MMTPEKILYETEVTATGGRDGKAASTDDRLSVLLSVPKSLGGPGGEGTNPEQLFAAGYAACFLGAVKLVARTPQGRAIRRALGDREGCNGAGPRRICARR
ncbi:Ohr subfamily peroxiredoxin [Bradyrhizobium diazoefficiens]